MGPTQENGNDCTLRWNGHTSIRIVERDVEGFADGPQSAVLAQVANGVAVRMAVIDHLLGA